MEAPRVPLRKVSGRFYRAVPMDRLEHVLAPPGPGSAGRYHRHGQPALYIALEADWAAISIARYVVEDGLERIVVPLRLSEARVVDQRDAATCAAYGPGIDPQPR